MEKYPAFVIAPQCPEGKQWVEVPWSADSHTMPKEPSEPLRLSLELVAALQKEFSVDKSRILRNLTLRSSELAMAQMQQIAACNALHSAEARLCRWILQARDRIDGDVIAFTQDFLAQMLAVRRPTVTLIAQKLQNAGLIRYRRGRIAITDHEGLEKLACECVGEIRNKTRQIVSELG